MFNACYGVKPSISFAPAWRVRWRSLNSKMTREELGEDTKKRVLVRPFIDTRTLRQLERDENSLLSNLHSKAMVDRAT
jgi:hypothetical protein